MLNYETVLTSGAFKIWERFQKSQAKLFLRSHLDGFVAIKILKYVGSICRVEFKTIIYFLFNLKTKEKTWPPFFKTISLYFSFFSFFFNWRSQHSSLIFPGQPLLVATVKSLMYSVCLFKIKTNLDFNHFIYFTKLAPASWGLQLHGMNDSQGWGACVFEAPASPTVPAVPFFDWVVVSGGSSACPEEGLGTQMGALGAGTGYISD